METGIYLSQASLAGLSARARAEIAKALFPSSEDDDDWEADVVRLTGAQAFDYVSKCSARSRSLLQLLIDNDGEMSHRAVRDHFGETAAQLKSAFGGLTKIARTVVGQKKAALIQWEQVGGEWIGYVHPDSVATLRVALEDMA
jgi:hypothetical protein